MCSKSYVNPVASAPMGPMTASRPLAAESKFLPLTGLCLLAVLLVPSVCAAQDAATIVAAKTLLEKSGDRTFFHYNPKIIVQDVMANSRALAPPDVFDRASAAVLRAFEPVRFKQLVAEGLAERLSADQIASITQWMETPLIKGSDSLKSSRV